MHTQSPETGSRLREELRRDLPSPSPRCRQIPFRAGGQPAPALGKKRWEGGLRDPGTQIPLSAAASSGTHRGTQPQGAGPRERGGAPGTKRPRAHLDSFGWALQGALNPTSRSPRLSPSPRRGAGKAALPRMFFLHPGSPPAPSIPGRPRRPPTPGRGGGSSGEGAPAGSPGRLRARQLLSPPAAAVPPPQRPPPLPPPQTKGRCPRRGPGAGAGPGRAGSGSAAAGRSSAPGPRLGAAPAGPQPGSPPHRSAGLGWARLGWAGQGRAGGLL